MSEKRKRNSDANKSTSKRKYVGINMQLKIKKEQSW